MPPARRSSGVRTPATEKQRISISDFEAEIMELEGSSESVNILLYGDSGCGKTVWAGSLPGNLLILAGEPGYISAARQGAKGKVAICQDTAHALAAVEWLENGNYKNFDWIIADGLSTMQTKWLLGYAAEAFDANPQKRAHRNLPDKPDYYNAQNFMKGWAARLVDLPVHVLFTAHAMRTFSDDGELLVYPQIQGKGYEVSNFVSGLMGIVGFMYQRILDKGPRKGEQARRIRWQRAVDPNTDTTYFAKDQYDALGMFTDDVMAPEILKMIESRPPGGLPEELAKPERRGRRVPKEQ